MSFESTTGLFKTGDVVVLKRECFESGSLSGHRSPAGNTFWLIKDVSPEVTNYEDGLFIVPCSREGIQTGDLDFGGWMVDSGEVAFPVPPPTEEDVMRAVPIPKKKRGTKKSRPEEIRERWMGKRIKYTLACFQEHGSWCNEKGKPADAEDEDVMESVFEVFDVKDIGTAARNLHARDVHYTENVRLKVNGVEGPFAGRMCFVAYGWEAVIVP